MTKIELLKSAVGLVCSAGITQIIVGIVEKNVTSENNIQKGCVMVGRVALTMVINDVVRTSTDAKIDKAVVWYDENVTKTLPPPPPPLKAV